MYPVSQDFHNQMKAQTRRIHAKIQVDYTDPFIDQSIQVSANENANYSYPEQVSDDIEEPHGKIASLDGSWTLDGTYVLAPTPEEAEELQMGWWGSQLSDESGNYTAPYPTLSVTFAPRPIHRLQVIADNKRKEWPVNFEINLYSNDTLMHTETVTGNTEIFWSTDIERVNEITKMELVITKWSHANRQVKILEFFTSIQETYETDDILLINLLEEREVSQGSLPVGNISSNEIDIRLVNKNGKFDAGNRQSPLYQLLKPNRRIKAWLRGEPAQIINPKPQGAHLWHFDRSVVSTDGIQPLSGAVYTLRPNEGRFGGAVAVEEGTTNIFDINNVRENYDYVSTEIKDNYHVIAYYNNPDGGAGNYAWSSGWFYIIDDFLFQLGDYTISFEARIIEQGEYTPTARVRLTEGDNVLNTLETIELSRDFKRFEVSFTVDETTNTADSIQIALNSNSIEFRKIQLEQKPFATSFVDGSRESGSIYLPKNELNLSEGTIAFWWNPRSMHDFNEGASHHRLFMVGDLNNFKNYIGINQYDSTEALRFIVNTGDEVTYISYTFDELGGMDYYNKWHFVALSWSHSNNYVIAQYDGQVKKGPYPGSPSTLEGDIHFGHRNNSQQANALFDELLILPYAATEEEIKAWYNSNAPFYDTEIKEWVPLGTFWSGDWTAPEGEIYVQTTGRDRLELLNQSTYSNSQVRQNVTLYELAIDVLEDYGLEPEEYFVDEELQNTVIPFAYFTPQSHREALRKIAEASLGQCYCDRDGLIRLEGYGYLQSKTEPDIVITRDDYFMKDNPANYMQIANYIEVETQPLRPAPVEEVYRSNEPVSINAGETISITAYYNVEPCIEPVASVEGVGTISEVTYYSWGADVKVTSSTAGEFELVINAKPLKVQGAEKIVAKDDDSIREHGRIKYTFPKNPLVQTRQQAQKIADNLLAYYKEPRRDLSLDWRGNPALLLGDRIQVVDEYGGEDFFVTMQNIEYDGGLKVSMEGRKVE